MPSVSVDAWRYHVGFAIDRGFVECWSPDATDAFRVGSFSEIARNHMVRISNKQRKPLAHGQELNVSSQLRPARLTYTGKEFIDNLNNPSIKAKALEAVK